MAIWTNFLKPFTSIFAKLRRIKLVFKFPEILVRNCSFRKSKFEELKIGIWKLYWRAGAIFCRFGPQRYLLRKRDFYRAELSPSNRLVFFSLQPFQDKLFLKAQLLSSRSNLWRKAEDQKYPYSLCEVKNINERWLDLDLKRFQAVFGTWKKINAYLVQEILWCNADPSKFSCCYHKTVISFWEVTPKAKRSGDLSLKTAFLLMERYW